MLFYISGYFALYILSQMLIAILLATALMFFSSFRFHSGGTYLFLCLPVLQLWTNRHKDVNFRTSSGSPEPIPSALRPVAITKTNHFISPLPFAGFGPSECSLFIVFLFPDCKGSLFTSFLFPLLVSTNRYILCCRWLASAQLQILQARSRMRRRFISFCPFLGGQSAPTISIIVCYFPGNSICLYFAF